jgi:hypothetical protein
MAYRSSGRFRQASTRLDTPPPSHRRHPGSAIAGGRREQGIAGDRSLNLPVINDYGAAVTAALRHV